MLRQAIGERIRPCIMINKMDRCILQKQMTYEELYQSLLKTIEKCNEIVATYADADSPMGDLRVSDNCWTFDTFVQAEPMGNILSPRLHLAERRQLFGKKNASTSFFNACLAIKHSNAKNRSREKAAFFVLT